MAYSQKIKNEVLQKLMEEGVRVSKLSLQYGMSVVTIYKWKREKLAEIADNEEKLKASQGKKDDFFQTNRKNFFDRVKVNAEDIDENVKREIIKREKNFYNTIKKYLQEKRQEIYVNMQSEDYQIQKTAVEQWDKMDALMERLEQNRENKEYINALYEKVSRLQNIENNKYRSF